MVKATDPHQKKSYVALCDRDLPPEDQTTWYFRVPTVREQRHMDNQTSAWELDENGQSKLVTRDGDSMYWPLKFSLSEPDNFGAQWVDEANRFDPSGPQLVSDSFLGAIPKKVRAELAIEALRPSRVSEKEEGKFLPQPTLPSDGPDASAGCAGDEEAQVQTE